MQISWPTAKLETVLTERKGKPDPRMIDSGEMPIVAKIGFSSGKIELRDQNITRTNMILVEPRDLVVSGINAAKGAIAIYNGDRTAAATIHFSSYVVNSEKADPLYLWYFMRSDIFRRILISHLPNGIKTEVKPRRLLSIEIPLPDIEEQRRIVRKVESLIGDIEKLQELKTKVTMEVENLVAAARGKLFRQAAEKGDNFRLDELTSLERGKFSYRPRNEKRFFGGKHPWIQIGEIEASNKFITAYSQTLNDDGLAISRKFPKGTLLISIAATIGAVGILDFDCCVPDSIVAITPKEGIDSEYLYHYLLYLRMYLERVAPEFAQKNINLKILAKLPTPKLPVAEQRKIVSYLDTLQEIVDKLLRIQAEIEKDIAGLVPSLLDKAFSGELLQSNNAPKVF
ncbi:MAG: restriction endonuclease subunit S [Candidatus Bathyarchaeia archaeon]